MALNRYTLMMRIFFLTGLLTACGFLAMGQTPAIQAIAPVNAGTQGQVVITGSGFSNTSTDLVVLFNNIKANIVSSSTSSILVNIPPQARMDNVEVINTASKLSGKSNLKFIQSFSGAAFDPTRFLAPTTFTSTKELFDICTCDFDGDGKPDLGATKFNSVDDPSAIDLIILKNLSTVGTLSFTQFDKTNLGALNVGTVTSNMNCGDLNGDGLPEIVAARAGATKNVIYYLKNNSTPGTLNFSPVQSLFIDPGQFAFRISIRDLNLDGKPELIVSNAFDDPVTDNIVHIFINQSSGGNISFNSTPVKLTVTGANTSYGLDVQDLDGDSKPDIIVNQFQSNDVYILRNLSTATIAFAAPVKIASTGFYNQIGTADVNQDGKLDMMLTSTFDNTLRVFLNQSTSGTISFAAPASLTTSTQPWGVDGSDIDGDGDVDIIVANKQDNFLNVFLNGGGASPSFTRSDISTAKFPRNLKVGDLDGDAKPDIAFTSLTLSNTYSLDILRNTNCISPVILNPAPGVVCSGQTITLKTMPAPGVTFNWKINGASVQNTTSPTYDAVDIASAGNYTVTTNDACGLTSPIYVLSSSAGSVPTASINPNSPVCIGGTLSLVATTTGTVTSYQWSGPAGFSSTVSGPSITNVSPAQAGLYKVQVADGSCKSLEASQLMDVATFPNFVVSSTTTFPGCVATGATLSINPSPGYQYQWLIGGAPIGGQTGTTLSATADGDYSVQITNIALSCTMETAKVTVQLYSTPVANFNAPATACGNTAVSFTSTSTSDARGTATYAWAFGDGGTATVASTSHTYTSAGTKTVTLTVGYTGMTGCTSVSTKTISIVDPQVPVILAPVTKSCPGESVVLTVNGTFNSITWSTGGTGSTITVTQPGNYSVNTVDQNTCASTGAFALPSKPVPTLSVTAAKTSITPGESVQLTATGADTYAWSPPTALDNATIANPLAAPVVTTTYHVTGSIILGCQATDSVKVTVSDANSIPAPLIFTPNGDGDNDLWKIPGIENYPDCTITVFDGHGSHVYERKGYINDWDGNSGGKQLPEATYFYVFSCPDKKAITGTVLIKR